MTSPTKNVSIRRTSRSIPSLDSLTHNYIIIINSNYQVLKTNKQTITAQQTTFTNSHEPQQSPDGSITLRIPTN